MNFPVVPDDAWNRKNVVDQIFSVETSAELDALVQTPKQFLDDGSFIGSNALKIQDLGNIFCT